MEDVAQKGADVLQETAEQIAKVVTENLTNGTETESFKASPEGLFVAYSSLVIMALIPIVVGSFKSVDHQQTQKESGEEIETMSTKEAMMFPVVASCTLFSIYLVFKVFSKDHINLLLQFYFFALGVAALTRMSSAFVHKIWPLTKCFNEKYDFKISLHSGADENKTNMFGFSTMFDREAILCFFLAFCVGLWYLIQKHWIANNIFGLAFAVNGIEFLQLNQIVNGCILLAGLFFYDIFWVFGTDVMVSVAKSFDAPIKLIFPQDLLENGIYANKMALLGLGDIVIPGIFIAILLRYDLSLKRNSKIYFYSSFIAYIMALFCTIFVMHVFKHAQPALLYIVPMCLAAPLAVALIKGDLKSMFAYRDHIEKEESKTDEKNEKEVKEDKEENGGSASTDESKSEKQKKKKNEKKKTN